MLNWKKTILCCLLGVMSAPAFATDHDAADEWEKTLEVYGWLPNIYISTAQHDHITITLGDILSNLKFFAFLNAGVSRGKWSFTADAVYFHVGSHSQKTTGGPFDNPIEVEAEVGIRAFTSTFFGGYEFQRSDQNELRGIFGARYLYLKNSIEVDVTVTPGDKKVTLGGHNWDGVIGLQGKTKLNDKWYMNYYADIGTGDSTITWQAKAGFGYHFNKFTGTFGLRYLTWNLKNSSGLDDLTVIGPYVGARWTW